MTASFSLGLEGVIRDIRGGTRPRHHQAVLVEQETQFPANNPAMIGEAFAADLLGAAAFAHGVDELDALRVDDTEDCGSLKKRREQEKHAARKQLREAVERTYVDPVSGCVVTVLRRGHAYGAEPMKGVSQREHNRVRFG